MIDQETLQFLEDLGRNNYKEWFHEHKDRYQKARANFLEVVQELIYGISAFDPLIARQQLEPKKTIMRINRDIRFSKDKTPYKTNFFTFLNPGGKKAATAGYYLSVSPNDSFLGGGIYMPDNDTLYKIRMGIEGDFEEWKNLLNKQSFKNVYGEVKPSGSLKNPPRGFDKESPAVEYLKYKGYYTQKMLSAQELTQSAFVDQALRDLEAAEPLVKFINRELV